MPPDAGLDALMARLRADGLSVGVDEELRLRRVLALAKDEPRGLDLGAVVASVVAKSCEEARRVREVFDAWAPAPAGPTVEPKDTEPTPEHAGPETLTRSPDGEPSAVGLRGSISRFARMLAAAALIAAPLGLAAAHTWLTRTSVSKPAPPASTASAPAPTASSPTGEQPLLHSYVTWVPRIEPLPPPSPWKKSVPWTGLAALAFAAAAGVRWRLGRKSWLPAPESPATRPGLAVVLPPAPVYARGEPLRLLDRADQESLVWGIGQFVSEEPTRRLDVEATVQATARACGLPVLRYEQARHEREVWLWTDDSVGAIIAEKSRSLERFAEEIARSLTEAGLGVERASFLGVPDELWSDQGRFEPLEVEERRDTALVAVLTDGRRLTRALASDSERTRVTALLRVLAGFPNLAFVDFSRGAYGLEAALRRHELSVLLPEQLPAFLGGSTKPSAKAPGCERGWLVGDARAWAAALALAPYPVDEATAFELRDELGLVTSPWVIDVLREEAPGPGGRLEWPSDENEPQADSSRTRPEDEPDLKGEDPTRAELLRWLTLASKDHGVDPPGLLGQGLAFWKGRLVRENERRSRREPDEPWTGTPAEQRLRLDLALLELWDEPERAIDVLYRLHGTKKAPGPLHELVRRKLSVLRSSDWTHPRAVVLPWKRTDLSEVARVALQEMGFGSRYAARIEQMRLARPGRYYLGLGAAVAAGVLLAVSAVVHAVALPRDERFQIEQVSAPPGAWARRVGGARETTIDVGHARYFGVPGAVRDAGAQKRGVRVVWKQQTVKCQDELKGLGGVWRCGSRFAARPSSWPERAEAVLVSTTPSDPDARAFAVALLDSGSVDRVLWGDPATAARLVIGAESANAHRFEFRVGAPGAPKSSDQALAAERWTRVEARSWKYLADAMRFSGIRTAKEAWPEASVEGAVEQVQGLGQAVAETPLPKPNVPFDMVWIPGGEFMMGSAENDKEADDDEKPAHRVRVSGFWMGKTEVSNADYRRVEPKHEGKDDLPAASVSWDEAKRFCEHYGLTLPTEAEWEYAARGTDGRKHPWGNEAPDTARAVFGRSWDVGPDPVGRHPQGVGPFGTLDQAGNVWEWVEDCYDAKFYGALAAKGLAVDPVADQKDCSVRVLRGGSFGHGARDLRSANRDWDPPGNRDVSIGFRCVRGSRRQPGG